MLFEYDTRKSAANAEKHGIDFDEAQALWHDENLLEVRVSYNGEPRFMVLGMIDGKHWTAIITYRGYAIRIVSVRRSRDKEVRVYGREDKH